MVGPATIMVVDTVIIMVGLVTTMVAQVTTVVVLVTTVVAQVTTAADQATTVAALAATEVGLEVCIDKGSPHLRDCRKSMFISRTSICGIGIHTEDTNDRFLLWR